jgi:hypothetical protein
MININSHLLFAILPTFCTIQQLKYRKYETAYNNNEEETEENKN